VGTSRYHSCARKERFAICDLMDEEGTRMSTYTHDQLKVFCFNYLIAQVFHTVITMSRNDFHIVAAQFIVVSRYSSPAPAGGASHASSDLQLQPYWNSGWTKLRIA